MRLWMALNGVILVALAVWILQPAADEVGVGAPTPPGPPTPAMVLPTLPSVPTKQEVLAITGVRFGIAAPEVPWSTDEINGIAAKAGGRPTMLQYFVKWNEPFRPDALVMCYAQGALPVLSWEPWSGARNGENQPHYALANIISGRFDAYIKRFATAVRNQPLPVAIRLAHEMNGNWYPWSESRSGNRPGEYVRAWRHVYDVFRTNGVQNVIWIWSPNIVRPLPHVDLRALYPGDNYVDWVGMVGYAAGEPTAAAVYDPTLAVLRKFTRKPIVITETGAPPGARKPAWIRDFFRWLPRHPDVIGFVWSEFTQYTGGNNDWRFTATSATAAAFRAGLSSIRVAPPPL